MAEIVWHRVAAPDALDEDDVTTVLAGRSVIALTRHGGRYGALDNRCPHENGSLGEGYIEGGWLVCPLHAYQFDPHDGSPSPDFDEGPPAYPVEMRDDGVYVGVVDLAASYEDSRLAFLDTGQRVTDLIDATEGAAEVLGDWRRIAVVGTAVPPPAGLPYAVQAGRLANARAIAEALGAWHEAYEAVRLAYNRVPREEKPSLQRLPEKYPPAAGPSLPFG